MLVHQQNNEVRFTSLTTLQDACEFLGIPYRETWFEGFHDPLTPAGADAHLEVSVGVANAIGDWLGFATSVLEQARRTPDAEEVTRVQLWPEHFDPAFEMGSSDMGLRASYGASPGDDNHPEPYLYAAAWGEIDRGEPYWNESTFNGASLSYRELLDATDQRKRRTGLPETRLRQAHRLIDLLLPTTDGGVLAQVLTVLVIGTTATVASRRHNELRLLVMGGTFFMPAMMGLRALHLPIACHRHSD